MHLSPYLYHRLIRPNWFTKKYIHNHIKNHFNIDNKVVLDFGSGTGANCNMFAPAHYLGIDPDAKRIHFSKKLYPEYTFLVFDTVRIPIHNQMVDYILIVAVLHHISSEQLSGYLNEFQRVLKPQGKIIIIEPYVSIENKFRNWFMNRYDNGEFIRSENDYLSLFAKHRYECQVIKKFKKGLFYNEIFFSAAPSERGSIMKAASHVKTSAAELIFADPVVQQAEGPAQQFE